MELIKSVLNETGEKYKVKILFACETGSRAWGFPSPDSDYDIRFIYMHEKDWYLSLSQRKDSIEIMNGDLDITGWDLRKSLLLLKRSNAALIERFQSPIVYHAVEGFQEAFRELIRNYYSPVAVFYHHYSLAHKFWDDLKEGKEIKLKSFFYLVRSLLSCHWIGEDKSVLPMDINGLMTKVSGDIKDRLKQLISVKATVNESFLHPRLPKLDHWINEMFKSLEAARNELEVNRTDNKMLEEFFLKQLNDADN
jgi:predicted nucleotidyltransferase